MNPGHSVKYMIPTEKKPDSFCIKHLEKVNSEIEEEMEGGRRRWAHIVQRAEPPSRVIETLQAYCGFWWLNLNILIIIFVSHNG